MLSREEIKTLLLLRQRVAGSFLQIPNEVIQYIAGLGIGHALQAIVEADYRKLARIVEIRPELIFASGTVEDISGEIIKTSPLMYSLSQLDTLAYTYFEKVCLSRPKLKDEFIRKIQAAYHLSNLGQPNLEKLYEAYETYTTLGSHYHKTHKTQPQQDAKSLDSDEEFIALKKSWLAIGLQQRCALPRHMLIDLCHCSLFNLAFNDILLMRVDKDQLAPRKSKTALERRLTEIMRKQDDCPIVLYDGKTYATVYLSIDFQVIYDDDYSHVKQLLPFLEANMPQTLYFPVRKNIASDVHFNDHSNHHEFKDRRGLWSYVKELSYPINNHNIFYNFLKEDMDYLLPLPQKTGLGYHFTLARGFNHFCFGMADPRGNASLLFAKAKEDYESLRQLIKLRLTEREKFFENYIPSPISNLSQDREINNSIK